MSIKTQNITKVYKSNRGVYDITLDIQEGHIYGLLGPNGAGKTTILKVLAGLLKKDRGEVLTNNVSLDESPMDYLRSVVGMIGDTVLYDYMTPMDHMKMMEVNFGDIALDKKEDVLREMDLYQFKDEPVKQFSTGMKQRLAFAMCIIGEPKVLLLDEPFSGLDIEGKLLIRNKLEAIRDEGNMAVVISSHLIHDLEEVATHVGIIKNGHLVEEQEVAVLRKRYKNLETYFVDRTMQKREGA